MIGRCLRAATDLRGLEGFTVRVDCDVLQADGGTRTACVTAGFVALAEALAHLTSSGRLQAVPLHGTVAAVSVGLLGKEPYLDLCYEEDVRAEVDVNLAMTGQGLWVEIQGTAENAPFSTNKMNEMMKLGTEGIGQLMKAQRAALAADRTVIRYDRRGYGKSAKPEAEYSSTDDLLAVAMLHNQVKN